MSRLPDHCIIILQERPPAAIAPEDGVCALQGAPTGWNQNITIGEFVNQHTSLIDSAFVIIEVHPDVHHSPLLCTHRQTK
jgi:hypothetical protein